MTKLLAVVIGSIAISLFSSEPATADSLRCDRRLVSTGDSQYQVRAVCGAPDAETRRVEHRTVRRHVSGPCRDGSSKAHCGVVEERTVEVIIDEWVYDFGSNRFVQHVLFEQGTLVRVISGSYGHKDPS